ncbi:unnamed protein product [Lactuca virosa]|uniref:Uncharacterized protein n=1 Tax=Lactuca virosa TaxID=75947 RepID=A0AAU9NDN3_9ASTR|nr:unnamed protein product [Lactuca virosa]
MRSLVGDASLGYDWEHGRRPIRDWEALEGLLLRRFRSSNGGGERRLALWQVETQTEIQRSVLVRTAPLNLGHYRSGPKKNNGAKMRVLGSKLDQIRDFDSGMTINKKLSPYLIKSTARKLAQHPGEIPPYRTSPISLSIITQSTTSLCTFASFFTGARTTLLSSASNSSKILEAILTLQCKDNFSRERLELFVVLEDAVSHDLYLNYLSFKRDGTTDPTLWIFPGLVCLPQHFPDYRDTATQYSSFANKYGGAGIALIKSFYVPVKQDHLEIHLFWAGQETCCIPEQREHDRGDWKLTPPVKTIYQENSLLANGEKLIRSSRAEVEFDGVLEIFKDIIQKKWALVKILIKNSKADATKETPMLIVYNSVSMVDLKAHLFLSLSGRVCFGLQSDQGMITSSAAIMTSRIPLMAAKTSQIDLILVGRGAYLPQMNENADIAQCACNIPLDDESSLSHLLTGIVDLRAVIDQRKFDALTFETFRVRIEKLIQGKYLQPCEMFDHKKIEITNTAIEEHVVGQLKEYKRKKLVSTTEEELNVEETKEELTRHEFVQKKLRDLLSTRWIYSSVHLEDKVKVWAARIDKPQLILECF